MKTPAGPATKESPIRPDRSARAPGAREAVLHPDIGNARFKEALAGVLVCACLFSLIAFVPLVGSVALVFAPLAVVYCHAKLGRVLGAAVPVAALVSILAALKAAGHEAPALAFLMVVYAGLVIAESLRRPWGIEKTVAASVLALLLPGGLFLSYHLLVAGQAPEGIIAAYLQKSIDDSLQMYRQMGLTEDQLAILREGAPGVIRFFTRIFPAVVLVAATASVWLNLLAARTLLRLHRLPFPDFGNLSAWKTPDRLIWILLAGGATLVLPVDGLRGPGLNVLLVCLFLYLLQGLAIVSSFFQAKKIPRFLRVLFYVILFSQHYLLLMAAALGLFDLWADFRRWIRPTQTA